jgi:hypothetical protein
MLKNNGCVEKKAFIAFRDTTSIGQHLQNCVEHRWSYQIILQACKQDRETREAG